MSEMVDRLAHRLALAEQHGAIVEGREVYVRSTDLRDVVEALRASDWQDMATAPQDGSPVDLWDRDGFRWPDMRWAVHYWLNGRPMAAPSWGPTRDGRPPDPTHWRRAPDAPLTNPTK